jgi:2-keto-4-pentenoate hydratase
VSEPAEAAAELLWRARATGRALSQGLPVDLRPDDAAAAYRIQALFERRSAAPLFGWKIAATSAASQARLGVDGPVAGRLLREFIWESGAEVPLDLNTMRVAEPEFAFRMKHPVRPRSEPYTVEEVMQAVEALHPALELPSARFEKVDGLGGPQVIADNAFAHHLVLGPAAPEGWRDLDLAAHRVLVSVGSGSWEGQGAAVLGDPRRALAWLTNALTLIGAALEPGQVVATGTCLRPAPIHPGDELAADFGVLGRVTLRAARAADSDLQIQKGDPRS